MADRIYRAIPITEDLYRIERYKDDDGEYHPIQAIERDGRAYWVTPSPTLRIDGKLFSTGTIDECRRIVALLAQNDAAKNSADLKPSEENIVYL